MRIQFNSFFTNVGPFLAKNIPPVATSFTEYLISFKDAISDSDLKTEEFETTFKSLKCNKAAGIDTINSNIVLDTYDEIKYILSLIFKTSLQEDTFPNKLKIAKVTPLLKSGDAENVTNYRPISVLLVFSKILERIMFNRICKHLKNNNLLFDKQFGFQLNNFTDHATLQLVNDISSSFKRGEYTSGIFINLSKAFDTVDHKILISKLEYYGIKGKTLKWLKSYLSERKQCISYSDVDKTCMCSIICGIPQGSILGPSLILIYVNDLYKASSILKPLMFSDNTNLFLPNQDINKLFNDVDLQKMPIWLKANKLFLNITKTKWTLFHSQKKQRLIVANDLNVDNFEIVKESVTKFLGIFIDKNLISKYHIEHVRSKISKSIGIMYKSRNILSKRLNGIFHLLIANKSNLISLYRHQKHAVRIIYDKDRFAHTKPLFIHAKTLTVYEINLFQTLSLYLSVKTEPRHSFFIIYTL